MWFGTWLGGLNRYDGYTFKVYKHDDRDVRSLGCDSIWTLHVDRDGVLWVGTNEGIDRYNRDTDSFVHYRYRPGDPASVPGYAVRSFYEDESGTLWVGSFGGLSRFDRAGGTFFTYRGNRDPSSFGDTDIRSVYREARTGLLWVGTWHQGVSVVDPTTGHYTRYKNDPKDPGSLSHNDVVRIFQDRNGILWVSTLGGLNRFDPKTRTFVRYLHEPKDPSSLSSNFVTMTYEDRVGRFWVATNSGLNLMDRTRGSFIRYVHAANDLSSLSSNAINYSALYEDASGTLWIGTEFAGVDRLAGVPERFTTYRHDPQDARSPSGNVIGGLTIDSAGSLWIGTEAGLDRFDGQTFTHYLADPNDSSRLNPGKGRIIAQDSRGTVWTATYGGGLERLVGQQVEHFRHNAMNSNSLANDNIGSLVPDTQGGLWIGTASSGMDYFDGRHFTHFPANPGSQGGLPDSHASPVLLDGRGMLWMTTVSWGLARFDTRTQKFTTYLLDANQPGNQAANWTTDIYSDGSTIWVGSTKGLLRFDPESGRFTRDYTEKDGLANNSVMSVLGDALGNIWVSTINGLSRFDPKTQTFRNYDAFDGLAANQFSQRSRAKTPDGRLYFGSVKGLVAFYPDKLADNAVPPPVVLTEFELFNKPVPIRSKDSPLQLAINVAPGITLRHAQSVFSLQFAALDYTAPQRNRYAHKLEGFDADWQYTDATRRSATYTNLDHGDYTFRVKASNNDGIWNEKGVALHIRILAPWWRRSWFSALVASAILAMMGAAYQLRMWQVQQESRRLRDVIETIPAYVWSAQPDGSVDFINRRWLEFSGFSMDHAKGWGWADALHPEDRDPLVEAWRAAIASGNALEAEARMRGADGQYRWLLFRSVPQRGRSGKIVKWYGKSMDITELKRAHEERERMHELEADLAHMNRVSMMGELSASIAHEINQPLAGIVSNGSAGLRFLNGDVPDVEEAREALRDIVRDGKRAGEIIRRIRALTKRTELPREKLDLNETIREVLALVGDEAKKNSVTIRTQLADEVTPVCGDRVQLQQVLLNLVMNAIQAMSSVSDRERQLVLISRNPNQGHAQVTVEDSGTGLGPDEIGRIFEPFYTTKSGGMGMGLSICRSILQNHGGRLWATANQGPGASFHFTLPTYKGEESTAGATAG